MAKMSYHEPPDYDKLANDVAESIKRNETMSVEDKETITYDEFRAWMTGLIRGKRGALPDIDDWKAIKVMMDKVVVEKEVVTIPAPYRVDPPPYQQPWNDRPWAPPQYPWTAPNTGDPPPFTNPMIWCSGSSGSAEASPTYMQQMEEANISVTIGNTVPQAVGGDELSMAIDEMIAAQENQASGP